MANQDLAILFDEMAGALRLLEANSFRAAADARVARTLRSLDEDAAALVHRDPGTAVRRLTELPGIGRKSAERIVEYVDSGRIAEHDALLAQVPEGLLDLLDIPGLGPKAVRRMWLDLGIEGRDDLREKLESGELAKLPRTGEKTLERLRRALLFQEKQRGRIPLGEALPLARVLVELLERVPGVERVAFAGSLRRGRETVGDIDLLAVAADAKALTQAFIGLDPVTEVLAAGDTRSSIRLEKGGLAVQVDLRIVPRSSWGAALLYFTGSKEHSVLLREIAISQGKHLNEYGLFAGTEERAHERGARLLAAADEESIYRELDLAWIPPELREELWDPHDVPRTLVEKDQIVSELHTHTRASDGRLTIAQIGRHARDRGLEVLAITDHSPASVIAHGLTPARLRRHVAAIRGANRKLKGIRLLAGAEVDILPDGSLDYSDEILAMLDVVVAAPHVSLRQSPAAATARLVRAVSHPLVHILGHPTGRLIAKREGLQPNMGRVFDAAAEHGTALEINANPRRLDLRDQHVRAALARGCLVAIDTDAHSEDQLDFLEYGVLTARRGGTPPESCINTWSRRRLLTWLARKKSR